MNRVQKEEFFRTLCDELVRRGVSADAAARNVRAIQDTLTEEDLSDIERITDVSEVSALAQAIVNAKRRSAEEKAQKASAKKTADEAIKDYEHEELVQYEALVTDDEEERPASPRGKRIFWIVFLCTLPITLVLFLLYVAVFAVAFAVLCALIILLVAGLSGGVAVGSSVSLIGIVYGVTQLLTEVSRAPGLYEIGLGVIIAGSVILGGILIYNVAIRLIPFLIRCLGSLFRYCIGKLKDVFHMAKEACYKL